MKIPNNTEIQIYSRDELLTLVNYLIKAVAELKEENTLLKSEIARAKKSRASQR